MHAWLPLRKVILRAVSLAQFPTATKGGLQVRVDPRDARFLDGLRQGLEPPLRLKDFLKSLASVRPTVSAEDIKKHEAWTAESGQSE